MKSTQVFTPPELAYKMVEMTFDLLPQQPHYTILEPSCGDGVFIDAILKYAHIKKLSITIHAFEIDPVVIARCKKHKDVIYTCTNTLLHDFGGKEFDIVIGNPPYVQLQSFGRQTTGHRPRKTEQELREERAVKSQLQNAGYSTFASTGDLYQLFYELGYMLLKCNGIMTYITSNKWMRSGYGKTTRKLFSTRMNPLILIDLGANVFESATVDSNVIVISKSPNQRRTQAVSATKQALQTNSMKFTTIAFDSSDGWFIGSPAEIALKQKIEHNGTPLKDWDVKINRGVLTGLNEAFIIDEKKRNELIAQDPRSSEIIKPILRGRDIKRYGYESATLYVINTHNGYKNETSPDKDGSKVNEVFLPININDYPFIKKHLDQFEPKLSKRADQGKTKYNLRNCAYLDEFEKEKVAWNRIASKKEFGFIDESVFISDSMHFFTGNQLRYIIAILNSKLSQFILDKVIGESAGGNAGNVNNVADIPIPTLDTPEKQEIAAKIEALVNQILSMKAEDGEVDIARQEEQIDELVFELYGLNDEEIALIKPD